MLAELTVLAELAGRAESGSDPCELAEPGSEAQSDSFSADIVPYGAATSGTRRALVSAGVLAEPGPADRGGAGFLLADAPTPVERARIGGVLLTADIVSYARCQVCIATA